MARGDQLSRQWQIIRTLLSARTGKTAAELAEALDCHPRTVYRDLQALQGAGFPIYTERADNRNLWSLLDSVRHEIPIPFSLPELMALNFGADLFKVFKDTVFGDALESLTRKIRATLPPASHVYLRKVEETLHAGIGPHKDYGRFRGILDRVQEAALGHRTLEIVYYTMSTKKVTKRRLDPYGVRFYGGTFYVVGRCHLRNEVRVFALDRIKMLHDTGEGFEIPPGFSLESFVAQSFGVFVGEPTRVKIWFSPDVAGYIREKIWHGSQTFTPQADGSLLFEAEVAGTRDIKFWVLTWGAHARVLAPEALRDEIRAEAEQLLALYRGMDDKGEGAGLRAQERGM